MRALKQFLKLKKGYCERQACRCLTVGMWRDYQNLPEVCDCGDWGSTPPVPPTPEIHVDSVSAPFTDNVTLILWEVTQVWFNFLPTNANTLNSDITVTSSDGSIAPATLASWWADWVAYIEIAATWVGSATVTYSFAGTSYNIAVTVNPEIYVETIDAPSENSITMNEWWEVATVTFNYTPTNANRIWNVSVNSSNAEVASGWISSFLNWTAELGIQSVAEWTATITYSIDWTSYDINVTVNALP